jgi:hypothetical protein
LSIRENAELTKYCTLLIGASSGITWISTSDWSKRLPTVQLVRPDVELSNSLAYDFQKRGVDTSDIIEMHSYSAQRVFDCVDEILSGDFTTAKKKFHQVTPLKFELYRNIQHFLVIRGKFIESFHYLRRCKDEHGFHIQYLTVLLAVFFRCLFLLPLKVVDKLKKRFR